MPLMSMVGMGASNALQKSEIDLAEEESEGPSVFIGRVKLSLLPACFTEAVNDKILSSKGRTHEDE